MGNWMFRAEQLGSNVDEETPDHGDNTRADCEPTPKVDRLEKDFVSKLLERLKGIENEFRNCMQRVREMERREKRCEAELDRNKTEYEKNIAALTKEKKQLEKEKEQKCQEYNQLLKKVEKLKKENELNESQIETLQKVKMQEQKKFLRLERAYQEQEQKMKELKAKMSASHDSRMRNRDIRTGDVTHDDMKSDFVDYFNTPRKFFKPLGIINQPDQRYQLLIDILQAAFMVCQDQVVKVLSEEFRSLLIPPKQVVTRDFSDQHQVPEEWRYRREAFSILLSVSGIDPHVQPPAIAELVKQNLKESKPIQALTLQSAEAVNALINKATKLAWEMVTLVPPAVLGTPNIQDDHWQTVLHGSDESKDSKIVYRKPILFFSAWGDVGEKGEIKLVRDKAALAQQEKPIPSTLAKSREAFSHGLCSPTTTYVDVELALERSGSESTTAQASPTPSDQSVPAAFQEKEASPIPDDQLYKNHQPPKPVESSPTSDKQLSTVENKAVNDLVTSTSVPSSASLACVSHSRNGSLSIGNEKQMQDTSQDTSYSTQQAMDSREQDSGKLCSTSHSPAVVDTTSNSLSPVPSWASALGAKQNQDLQPSTLDRSARITSNPFSGKFANNRTSSADCIPLNLLPSSFTPDQQENTAVEEASLEILSSNSSPTYFLPEMEAPPSDTTYNCMNDTAQVASIASENTQSMVESHSPNDNAHLHQDAAQPDEVVPKQIHCAHASPSVEVEATMKTKRLSQQVSTQEGQVISVAKSSAEKVKAAIESDENLEVVRNATTTEYFQVLKTDECTTIQTDLNKEVKSKDTASPVQQERGTTNKVNTKSDSDEKINQSSAHASNLHKNSQELVSPSLVTGSTPCAQASETGDCTVGQSDTDKKAKINGSTSQVQTEHGARGQASMELDSGGKTSRSGACSSSQSPQSVLPSQEGSSERGGVGEEQSRKRSHKKRGTKNSKQDSAKKGKAYPCPVPLSEARVTGISKKATHHLAKNVIDMPTSSKKPLTEQTGDVWDVD